MVCEEGGKFYTYVRGFFECVPPQVFIEWYGSTNARSNPKNNDW